jgi:integrase
VDVLNKTAQPISAKKTRLDPTVLAHSAQAAAEAFIAAGTAENTLRSYRSALNYWQAWLQLRYDRVFGDDAIPVPVVVQFIVDHLARPAADGTWHHLLSIESDLDLCKAGVKGKPGPLAFSTVSHRLAVLGKWHKLKQWDNPCAAPAVAALLREAGKAQVRQGIRVRKKTALTREPLQALLATCSDGLRGLRDKALLLLAWSGGGRRRSEVVTLRIEDLRRLDEETWLYALGATKTETSGQVREKPLRGAAARALDAWLKAAPCSTGPIFRRIRKYGQITETALSGDAVARMIKRRAKLAGLEGDWAAHSLRSGFVTEAGRQGVPLGEVMAMTEHRSVNTVMGYFQAGALLSSRATRLLEDDDQEVSPGPE